MFCRALCLAAGRWAKRNGTSVSALVLNDIAPDARYVDDRYISYFGAGKSKAKFIQHYLRHILTTQYDWIIFGHVSLSPLALYAKTFNSKLKTAVITYGIEVWQPLSPSQRKALQQADVVLAISDYTKEELVKHSSVPAHKIHIFPCALDPFWQTGVPLTTQENLQPVMLSVTRMNKEDRYKAIDNVIRSLPAIVEKVGAVQYRVVGQGDDVPRLRALAAGLGMSRYVTFLGGVTDAELREQYGACSLFIMPSKKEGFGIVFLEAMAYGKPVIGGAHGGTPSVVKDGETGFLVDSADVEGIAQSITRLLGDEEMRETFGRAGQQRLLDKFTFESFERNLQEVFHFLSW
jgi:phosphatidylinositol alpha-1,6-mannosyltransferase